MLKKWTQNHFLELVDWTAVYDGVVGVEKCIKIAGGGENEILGPKEKRNKRRLFWAIKKAKKKPKFWEVF